MQQAGNSENLIVFSRPSSPKDSHIATDQRNSSSSPKRVEVNIKSNTLSHNAFDLLKELKFTVKNSENLSPVIKAESDSQTKTINQTNDEYSKNDNDDNGEEGKKTHATAAETEAEAATATTADCFSDCTIDNVSAAHFQASVSKWANLLTRAVVADFLDVQSAARAAHARESDAAAHAYIDNLSSLTRRVRDLEAVLAIYKTKMEARNAVLGTGVVFVLNKVSNRNVELKCFALWKTKCIEMKRMHLAERVAAARDRQNCMRRALFGWQRVCGATWRRAVEKSVRIEAEKAMEQLSNEYEDKISQLRQSLNDAQSRLSHSQQALIRAQADMKNALMRGVCALNMEAMSIFRTANNDPQPSIQKTAPASEINIPNRENTISTQPLLTKTARSVAVEDIRSSTFLPNGSTPKTSKYCELPENPSILSNYTLVRMVANSAKFDTNIQTDSTTKREKNFEVARKRQDLTPLVKKIVRDTSLSTTAKRVIHYLWDTYLALAVVAAGFTGVVGEPDFQEIFHLNDILQDMKIGEGNSLG
ncbi:Centrosomal protein poc5 [Physocladia obscura]|uniref:Centrosomal protein POC5 n=1 Tax=Physocladia obscura TaxID=109957 RepID=A0AAD5XDV6_9FUNG|nr:Centrosomal protein poc5 [Physocladia obscura]